LSYGASRGDEVVPGVDGAPGDGALGAMEPPLKAMEPLGTMERATLKKCSRPRRVLKAPGIKSVGKLKIIVQTTLFLK
jgi:hypothetical protein